MFTHKFSMFAILCLFISGIEQLHIAPFFIIIAHRFMICAVAGVS